MESWSWISNRNRPRQRYVGVVVSETSQWWFGSVRHWAESSKCRWRAPLFNYANTHTLAFLIKIEVADRSTETTWKTHGLSLTTATSTCDDAKTKRHCNCGEVGGRKTLAVHSSVFYACRLVESYRQVSTFSYDHVHSGAGFGVLVHSGSLG
jgi:hypothetical protein